MTRGEGACLVWGKPLTYFEKAKPMECVFCHRSFLSYASCQEGHYVCDTCHSRQGAAEVVEYCLHSKETDPIAILQGIMETPYIHMHGPEHHIMVGAALLTAYQNAGGALDLPEALQEMKTRGAKYPGGSCGFWGCCGAAVSTGMFWSVLTGTTPLSGKSWGQGNLLTARSLQAIGSLGGPRCCKRNSFTAVRTAVEFIREELGVAMDLPEKITCDYTQENKQCLKKACPYYKGNEDF